LKIQSLFTKAFWLTLVCISVMLVTIFRLTPSLAGYTTTTQPVQVSATPVFIAQYDSGSERSGGRSLYQMCMINRT
jgi:hemoglobin